MEDRKSIENCRFGERLNTGKAESTDITLGLNCSCILDVGLAVMGFGAEILLSLGGGRNPGAALSPCFAVSLSYFLFV